MAEKIKDHVRWMAVKSEVNNNFERPTYKEGDVYWICIGENVGFEQDGKGELFARPVLVIRGFSREIFWGIPLTSQRKKGEFYFEFEMDGRKSVAILSQLRVFDTARVSGKRLGRINGAVLLEIKNKLKGLL